MWPQSMEQRNAFGARISCAICKYYIRYEQQTDMSVSLPIMSIVKSLNGKIHQQKSFGKFIRQTSGCIQHRSVFQSDIKNGFFQIIRRRWQNFGKNRDLKFFERVKFEMHLILIRKWVILCEVKLIV